MSKRHEKIRIAADMYCGFARLVYFTERKLGFSPLEQEAGH